jgi:DNA-binding CsgD family transcriptional regulator
MLIVASVRLLIKKQMRLLWRVFLSIAVALTLLVSYGAISRVIGIAAVPRPVVFAFQVALLGLYLTIAAIVFHEGSAGPRLNRISLKGLSIFLASRPSLDFLLAVLHATGLVPYYQFLVWQYLVEFLTYLLIFCFIQKFALIFSAPEPVSNGSVVINEDVLRLYSISEREKQVIELVVAGLSNKEISDKLFISVRTVKDHIYNIYRKTDVKNRVQLSNLFRER